MKKQQYLQDLQEHSNPPDITTGTLWIVKDELWKRGISGFYRQNMGKHPGLCVKGPHPCMNPSSWNQFSLCIGRHDQKQAELGAPNSVLRVYDAYPPKPGTYTYFCVVASKTISAFLKEDMDFISKNKRKTRISKEEATELKLLKGE